MSRVIICDRCKKTMPASVEQLGYIAIGSRITATDDLDASVINPFEAWDFCPDCVSSVKSFIMRAPEATRIDTVLEDVKKDIGEIKEKCAEIIEEPAEPEQKAEAPVIQDTAPIPKEAPRLADEEDLNSKKKPGVKPIQLDMGKLRALWDAGWTVDMIADEMRVSATTVKRRLSLAK